MHDEDSTVIHFIPTVIFADQWLTLEAIDDWFMSNFVVASIYVNARMFLAQARIYLCCM